ncbi:hypothetical protein AERO_07135 [Aeromicrobium fastidiosum]|uniref:hypothetical protein n=1 Tax=Aeromicrobium fastidiosum TaxID=52699 RepID=UPI0020236D6F|nr:hypothetical protein [Aeromicrobium fastidiosum]MCL8251153.1 hypothetical protein [Aeromicrobium fastidiosum]
MTFVSSLLYVFFFLNVAAPPEFSTRLASSAASDVYKRQGVWTAAEVGSRALGDADAVPFGDYHVAKDVGVALLGRRIDDVELAEVLEPWRGHRFRVVRLVGLSPLVGTDRRGPRMARVDHRRI